MKKTRNIILVAMFAALTAIGAFIKIPIPYIPITLQYFFCALSGIILGSKLGALSQLVYVCIGLLGVPVFTGGGGFNYIFKPSFGYLIGFIVAAYVIGKLREKIDRICFIKVFLSLLIGLFFIYLFGVAYFYISMNMFLGKNISIYFAILNGFVIFIPSDLLSTIITSYIAVKIMPILKKAEFIK